MGCLHSKQPERITLALGGTARLPRLSSTSTSTSTKLNISRGGVVDKNICASHGCGDEIQPPRLDETGRMLREEVEQRRTFSDMKTTEIDIGGGKIIRLRYASCTQRGYYPDEPFKNNQDAISITQDFAGEKGDLFFGVYDGHGSDGHDCSNYARDHLPKLISKYVRQERAKLYKEQMQQQQDIGLASNSKVCFNPKLWPKLDAECYERACRKAHLDCNSNMIDELRRASLSGTTSISAGFHNGQFTISNVGDSRAVLGYRDTPTNNNDPQWETWLGDDGEEKREYGAPPQAQTPPLGKLIAVPLSVDQTSWRKDERKRIKHSGGRVRTIDQIKGHKPILSETETETVLDTSDSDNGSNFGDRILGTNDDQIDLEGDPPRVWLPDKPIPGTAFTRSLGDHIAQRVGVIAEPEMCTKDITGLTTTGKNEVLVLASDGVFEFLTNQEVINMCDGAQDGTLCVMDACRKIMDSSYERWLEYENRTDDISVIVICIDAV